MAGVLAATEAIATTAAAAAKLVREVEAFMGIS
jgi:hypothetical protein